jgi:hypothetical protein
MKNGIINARFNKIIKIAAGLLLFFGSLRIHKFFRLYIRRDNMVINQCFTCGILTSLLGLEGIIYLTKSDEEFYQTYQVGKACSKIKNPDFKIGIF